VKKDGIAALGTTVNDTADDYDHAMVLAKAHAAREGIPFINPCLGEDLLAGQGTVALEVLTECPDVQQLYVCVGGGGLLGGVGAVMRRVAPSVRIVGAQSERTAAMARSVAAGEVVEIASERTLADGLAGQIDDDALAIGQRCLDDIVVLSESAIGEAIAWLHVHEGLRVEGAGAVTVAALLEAARAGRAPASGPVVAIVSGRNIDAERHAAGRGTDHDALPCVGEVVADLLHASSRDERRVRAYERVQAGGRETRRHADGVLLRDAHFEEALGEARDVRADAEEILRVGRDDHGVDVDLAEFEQRLAEREARLVRGLLAPAGRGGGGAHGASSSARARARMASSTLLLCVWQ
jgi:hypothetical protein